MSILSKDIKKLYGMSAGRCNLCPENIMEEDVQIGEMAHIIAKNSSGPRGDASRVNINSYENLILLCPNCHRKIDKNPSSYSEAYLLNMKEEHEDFIATSINRDRLYKQDINSIQLLMDYMPFSQIRFFCESLPYSIDVNYTIPIDTFENFQIDNPHLYPFNDKTLTLNFDNFIHNLSKLHDILSGSTSKKSDGSYELITQNMMINGQISNLNQCFSNYSAADMTSKIHINKRFIQDEALEFLINEVENQKKYLLSSYFELMDYLKFNYKSINLNSYTPYTFD